MSYLKKADPELYDIMLKETERQATKLVLIASENYVSEAVLEANGGVMTNKYAEGYPGKAILRRLRVCRPGGESGPRPRQRDIRVRACQCPAAFRLTG